MKGFPYCFQMLLDINFGFATTVHKIFVIIQVAESENI